MRSTLSWFGRSTDYSTRWYLSRSIVLTTSICEIQFFLKILVFILRSLAWAQRKGNWQIITNIKLHGLVYCGYQECQTNREQGAKFFREKCEDSNNNINIISQSSLIPFFSKHITYMTESDSWKKKYILSWRSGLIKEINKLGWAGPHSRFPLKISYECSPRKYEFN